VTGGRWTAGAAGVPAGGRPGGDAAAASTGAFGPFTGFHFDTRQLRRGEVFVALKSEKRDGHAFLAAAAAAGAGAAIVSTPDAAVALPQLVVDDPLAAFHAIAREHRRAFGGKVVGISGSAGKTSTKDLLALLLGGASCGVVATEDRLQEAGVGGAAPPASPVLATEGNLNNHLGVPLMLTRIDPSRHAFAVIEAGISTPGEMAALADMIAPDVSLITLIAPAHTAALGGLEGVAREKAVLSAATRPDGVAVLAKDTADYAAFRELTVPTLVLEHAAVVRPAEAPRNRVYYAVSHRGAQTAISLAYGPPPPSVFALRRVSDGQAQNAALAICVALQLGVTRRQIQQRLGAWQPARLRGEIREDNGRLLYLDCYNANPVSMIDALRAFAAIAPSAEPRLYVLGCMAELGPEAPAHHRTVGRAVPLRERDCAMIIGEHAHELSAGILERGSSGAQIHIVASLAPIAATLAEWRGAVFVKGSRRYQLEQILEAQTSLPLPC
jgi:UDP-N-acetylmuramoyl-tripeptide--D-alanyl-D-alanine ligase